MDAGQIKQFIDAMAASDLGEMEVTHAGWTLRLARTARASPSGGPAASSTANSGVDARPDTSLAQPQRAVLPAQQGVAGTYPLCAPLYGIVHLQPAPGEAAYARAGDPIEVGQLLCIVEAMKVFNEVRAERSGRLAQVLVPSGVEVEAGQTLMLIDAPA